MSGRGDGKNVTELTRELVRIVMRAFYEDKYTVIMDYLLRERMLTDEGLADRMKFTIRDIGKLTAKLREDRLIRVLVRQEMRSSDEKFIPRTYYFIDFAAFADVVKLRLFKMRKQLEDRIKNDLNDKGYLCPNCKKAYSTFDVVSLHVNPQTYGFECEVCSSELISTDASIMAGDTRALSRLVELTNPITRLLKRLEEMEISPFDPEDYIQTRAGIVDETSLADVGYSMIRVAGSDDRGSRKQDGDDVIVEFVDPNEKAAPKPTAHALPDWYTRSIVTNQSAASAISRSASDSAAASAESVRAKDPSVDYFADEYIRQYEAISIKEAPYYSPMIPVASVGERSSSANVVVTVTVKGLEKSIDDVTEEDKNEMTEEEYQKYYETYMSVQQ